MEKLKEEEEEIFKDRLISNIKNKDIGFTSYGNHEYSYYWYVDNKNKICITFSPRAGCSISFQQYLNIVGLLEDGLSYHPFIHSYRMDLFNKNIPLINIDELIKKKYTFIKFIMNPYIRAVSIYRWQTSTNLSFKEYLKQILNNEISCFSHHDLHHNQSQYIEGEENIITKYIKINENEKYNIKLHDNTIYEIDLNKFTSQHHGKKTDYSEFCGDIPRDQVNEKLPKSYRYFYDDEIKSLVYNIYKNDIEKYGFNFEDWY